MAKKYIPARKPPSQMTTEEVRAWLSGLPDSLVIRSILKAEIDAIRAGAEREARTLRGLWYDTVKPLLSRAGILNSTTKNGKPIEWDANLSRYLAELVRMGITSYEEMLIVDGSRQRQTAQNFVTQFVDVQMVGDHFPWVILFTEKDTIWPVVQALASLYGVSAISGGGQPSDACTENTVREIIRSETFQKACPEKVVILSLTDYDPAGYNIARSQHIQVREAIGGVTPKERGNLRQVENIRLGLEPSQLTPEERIANAYEPKSDGLEKWYQETGGVDGQRLGLELDSLPLSRLRQMFAQGIERVINLEMRRQDLRDAFIDLMACELLLPEFEARRSAMIKAVKSNGLWKEINTAAIPNNLFSRAAINGNDWIGPETTKLLFQGFEDQVKEAMKEAK